MAARTLTQLSAAVAQLGFTDPDGLTFSSLINEEYKSIAGERRWEWLQATNTTTGPAVAGTFSYAFSMTDARNLDAVFITDAQLNSLPLHYMDPLVILEKLQDNPALNTGRPRYWSSWGNRLLLFPNPDATYPITIYYTLTLGDIPLASGGAKPLMPGDYDTALVWGAGAMMAVRMRDWIQREYMTGQRDRVIGAMRSDYQLKQRQDADEVVSTGIWDQTVRGGWWPYG